MKFAFGMFLIFIGCVFAPHSSSTQLAKLPSLYGYEYGIIGFVNTHIWESSLLNVFWAQEAIGTPEARLLIKEMQRDGFKFFSTRLGILDVGFDERKTGHPRFTSELNQQLKSIPIVLPFRARKHGTRTLSVIIGQEPAGVSSLGEVDLILARTSDMWKELDTGRIPDVVNSSSTYRRKYTKDLLRLDKQVMEKTIWVNSVGNRFPKPIADHTREIGGEAILVGSADPGGFPSTFSSTSEHVTVLAPSDYVQRGIDAKGKIVKYGGTSGAAPMVTGVLADVKSILPSLTRDEAAYMLQQTATRTTINNISTVNGAGMLNHYKMLRVAQRLHKANFADNRHRLYRDRMYDFSDEASQLTNEAKLLLASTHGLATNNTKAFKKLRKAFFLDSANEEARTLLADIYQQHGHVASAEFYHPPLKNFDQVDKSDIAKSINAKVRKRSVRSHKHYRKQELKKFGQWLRARGKFDRKEISNIEQEIKTAAEKFRQILFKQENALEVKDHDHMLEILIHSVHDESVSDKTMALFLEYASEHHPFVFAHANAIIQIQNQASNH